MFVFASLILVGLFGVSTISTYRADINRYVPQSGVADLKVDLTIKEDGSVYLDGQKYSERVNILPDSEEIRFPVIDNVGQDYSNIDITVTLPSPIAENTKYDFIGVHGVGSTTTRMVDDSTLVFHAQDVAGTAILTPVVVMPKGTIKPPLPAKIYADTSAVRSNVWVYVGIALPILTFFLMLVYISLQMQSQKVDYPDYETSAPPMAIPPALVGVLFHQRVGSRELAATLIDLAIRGDIFILDRERDFAFVKNKFDRRLLTYEKVLLSKIFKTNLVSDKEEVDRRINNHLYSKKLSLATAGVYILATRLGYFRLNPHRLHLKYLFVGILGFFLGLAGFILSLRIFPDSQYVAFLWLGLMASSLVVMFTSSNIPNRTGLGREALTDWLAFKNYLTKNERMPFSYENQTLFLKYLPYAIVLECEIGWAKRFSEQGFEMPDWFVTDRGGVGLQDFCLALYPIVSYVAKSFAAIREPGYK
ncbi:MAG: DUF2207 domain-containing protein [Candidatus Berkelbacteria bacterium]|nr:DUF2207 domain-containing protein [Candidatus Berkelbacteria bacterium]